jgi:hypothetical protein
VGRGSEDRGHRPSLRRELQNPRARKVTSDLGIWVEPPVGIEPTTFSLRGGPTASHPLSASVFVHADSRTARETPHRYPRFRATSDATPTRPLRAAQDHPGPSDQCTCTVAAISLTPGVVLGEFSPAAATR